MISPRIMDELENESISSPKSKKSGSKSPKARRNLSRFSKASSIDDGESSLLKTDLNSRAQSIMEQESQKDFNDAIDLQIMSSSRKKLIKQRSNLKLNNITPVNKRSLTFVPQVIANEKKYSALE